jgi:tripeptidyl-peptidase-1
MTGLSGGSYNRSGRGFPDVSLLGHKYVIVATREYSDLLVLDGTSASAPVMAGLISVANAARKEIGKPTLGFVNPFLYKRHATYDFINDITSGDNKCTAAYDYSFTDGYLGTCCQEGFYTGSIDFEKFLVGVLDRKGAVPTAAPWKKRKVPTAAPSKKRKVPTAAPSKKRKVPKASSATQSA